MNYKYDNNIEYFCSFDLPAGGVATCNYSNKMEYTSNKN